MPSSRMWRIGQGCSTRRLGCRHGYRMGRDTAGEHLYAEQVEGTGHARQKEKVSVCLRWDAIRYAGWMCGKEEN